MMMLGRSWHLHIRKQVRSPHRIILSNHSQVPRAHFHGSSAVSSLSPLRMPALSPTMESGQISSWKIRTGEKFSTGDILLTVETDKAEVDVEAQDDGYMGPQLLGPGSSSERKSIDVGELIAILGEDADDVQGNVEVPATWNVSTGKGNPSPQEGAQKSSQQVNLPNSSSKSQASGSHSKGLLPKTALPLSPAVSRILIEHGVEDATKIKGTGLHGRLTKGDVLTHLGEASSPLGSAQKMIQADADARADERSKLNSSPATNPTPEQIRPMDGLALRRFITEGLSDLTRRPSEASTASSFESIIQDYQLPRPAAIATSHTPLSSAPSHDKYFDGLDRFL